MLPPLGSYVPVYKRAREQARGRLGIFWIYVAPELAGHPGIADVLQYQALANHILPEPWTGVAPRPNRRQRFDHHRLQRVRRLGASHLRTTHRRGRYRPLLFVVVGVGAPDAQRLARARRTAALAVLSRMGNRAELAASPVEGQYRNGS